MVWKDFFKLLRRVALVGMVNAAFLKATAWFRINRRGDFTFQNDALFFVVDIYRRNCGNERLCVGVQRMPE